MLKFFLGGADLEMQTISQLVCEHLGPSALVDAGLSWGAQASDYRELIRQTSNEGDIPVLIELSLDMPLPTNALIIDHHNDRAGGATSLHQVFDLLGLDKSKWTRQFELVAANDTGHVAALRAAGASLEEILDIRRADRAAQGISQTAEDEGLEALNSAQTFLDGSLLIVRLPHKHTATVTDPLAMKGDDRDLLVFSPISTNFFGAGTRIQILDEVFHGGWRGGELPKRGFWGHPSVIGQEAVLSALLSA